MTLAITPVVTQPRRWHQHAGREVFADALDTGRAGVAIPGGREVRSVYQVFDFV